MNAKNLSTVIATCVKEQFDISPEVVVTRPDEQFGDFATNVALQLAGKLQKKPRDIAEIIAADLRQDGHIQEVTIAGPGFINIRLKDQEIAQALQAELEKQLTGQEILVEFGDPNPFKAMHLGHLYTTIVGDAISNLLERAGADVKRLSYHGDVGMHVARAMWALLKEDEVKITEVLQSDTMIGAFYAKGATAYKEDPAAKEAIEKINRQVYELRLNGKLANDDTNGRFETIYKLGFDRSFTAFEAVFAQLGVHYAKRYLESESTKAGVAYVEQNTGKVFEKSDGAIIYRGEKVGLHTRVFINSLGLPTYEAKDLGLAELKNNDFPDAAQSIIITANEQSEYFKVMLAALKEIDEELSNKTRHIAHGFLSLTSGKMSSRQGIGDTQVAANLLQAVQAAVSQQFPDAPQEAKDAVYLAAAKYTFLKNRIGGDIVFNVEESVALEGNSGPYIQYAHARARSILRKAGEGDAAVISELEPSERSLARKISEYPEVLARATDELMPHHICTYLYELAQCFNRFYEHNRVIDDPRQDVRLELILAYADVLKDGLGVLGIAAPEQL